MSSSPRLAIVAVQLAALLALGVREPDLPTLTAVSVFFGLGVGVLITLPPLLTSSVLTGHAFEATVPLVNALGAPVFTLIHEATGSYGKTAVTLAAAHGIAVVLIALSDPSINLKRPNG